MLLPRFVRTGTLLLAAVGLAGPARAHDPVFGLGPHVLYKGGLEVAPEYHLSRRGEEREQELGLEVTYGLTGDWAAGVELPYVRAEEGGRRSSGLGDMVLFTKYRFWRHDRLGVQESASVAVKVVTDTGDETKDPALGKGTTDTILGLAYGYESRKWYRWASIRYRANGSGPGGLERGDRVLLDFVVGIRPVPTGYLEPDTVWLLELNGEYGQRARLNGAQLNDTGGTEWFISPGIFWTKRNFAIKAGLQIPVAHDLNGTQEESDYRAKLVLEWHL